MFNHTNCAIQHIWKSTGFYSTTLLNNHMSASVQTRSAKHLNQPSEPSGLYINALEKSGAVREADEEEDDG